MGTPNVRRLGWLVCTVGLATGCGSGPQDPDLRALESIGLVTDQGTEAIYESLGDIWRRAYAADVEVVETLVRVGMIYNIETIIQNIENGRNDDNNADVDRAIAILQAADPVAAMRQGDEEVRSLTLDNVLANVPNNYHEFLTDRCGGAAVLMVVCVENHLDVVVQIFEPDGPRRQFGVWVRDDRRNPTRSDHIVISDASGGAQVCDGIGDNSLSGGYKYGGAFNDDGVLTVEGTYTIVVQERDGVEFLTGGGRTYMRVTEPSLAAFEAYELCLGP